MIDYPSISHKASAIRRARIDKQQELMWAYDKEVYYPALKALRDECGVSKAGHDRRDYSTNGFGWETWRCSKCGAIVEQNQFWKFDEQEETEE